jgi:hypothetical protein
MGGQGQDLTGFGYGQAEGSCEPSRSIKCGAFLDPIRNQDTQGLCSTEIVIIYTLWSRIYSVKIYSVSHSLPNPAFFLIILTPMKILQRNLN